MTGRAVFIGLVLSALSSCGVIYTAPGVHDGHTFGGTNGTDLDVKVVSLTYESAAAASLAPYIPARLPLAFQPDAAAAAAGGSGGAPLPALPPGSARPTRRPGFLPEEFPPLGEPQPYRIGVADMLLLAVNSDASLNDLPGLISAQAKRQGYIVQDDGAIAIPDAGRVHVANMTLQDAEAEIFRALAAAGIDPSFSLEIAEFNSQRVAVGGLVNAPTLVPISLKPLHLHEAIELAGGLAPADPDTTQVHLFRNGSNYRIGLGRLASDPATRHILLQDGDSVFVGSAFDEDEAQRYFAEQLQLRQAEMQGVQFQVQMEQIRAQREANAQTKLSNERQLFKDRLELGAVERAYAYRTGEVRKPGRVALPFERSMTLADALFDDGGIDIKYGDYGEIYVLRAASDPQQAGGLTAYHLDAGNAVNLTVATRFELRPNDVIFVAEQPVTSWNRALSQIMPQIFVSQAARYGL